MEIKIINKSKNENPKYSKDGDSGMDLRAMLDYPITLLPFKRVLVPTGVHLELPKGYEGQVRGRSGLALEYGVGVVQGIGTIDSNYTGDIGVILVNHGQEAFVIENGDRIAQLVICKVEKVDLVDSKEIKKTNRGTSGYGSTGVK